MESLRFVRGVEFGYSLDLENDLIIKDKISLVNSNPISFVSDR
jgi:hypothetical protein